MSRELSINGDPVQVQVKVNRRALKTVSIEIKSEDRILIKVPKDSEVDIDLLLDKYKPLIEKKYQVYRSLKPVYENGVMLFNGQKRRIDKILSDVNLVSLDEDVIRVEHKHDFDPSKLLKEWISDQTKTIVEETMQKFPQLRKPLRVTVTDTTRWGYTRRSGVIVLNWQLSTLPFELAEYVVVHELVHLEHSDHSNGFYRKLAFFLPDYKCKVEKIREYVPIKSSSLF